MWTVNIVVALVVVIDVVAHRRLHPAFGGWGSLAMLMSLNVGYEVFQTGGWIEFVTRIFT